MGEGTGTLEADASADADAVADADAASDAAADAEADAAADADALGDGVVDDPQDATTTAAANARVQVVRKRFTATPPSRERGMPGLYADSVYRVASSVAGADGTRVAISGSV